MEGLIGFIIMIIIINVASRILKGLGSSQAKPGQKGPRVKVPPRPDAQKQRAHPYAPPGAQLEHAEVAGHTVTEATAVVPDEQEPWSEDRFETEELRPAESYDSIEEERFRRRRTEPEGDFAQWAEDRFEELAVILGHKPKATPLPSRPSRKATRIERAKKEEPPEPAVAHPSPPITVIESRADERWLYRGLDSRENLRRAIVLATILGPCKANRRIRRRRLID
jgi:hypothetical protein